MLRSTVAVPQKHVLEKLYYSDKLTGKQIANIFECDLTTVYRWLKEYNMSTTPYLMSSGKYSVGWQSRLETGIKNKVRKRDGFKCIICGKPTKENKGQLLVHHIYYDKSDSNIHKLISLCKSCHGTMNGNQLQRIEECNFILSLKYLTEYVGLLT